MFYDFVYYRICHAYSKANDNDPGFIAVCIVSLLQGLTIMVIIDMYSLIVGRKIIFSTLVSSPKVRPISLELT